MRINGMSVIGMPTPSPNDVRQNVKHGGKAGLIGLIAALAGLIGAGAIVNNNPELEPGAEVMAGTITTIVAGALGWVANWLKHRK